MARRTDIVRPESYSGFPAPQRKEELDEWIDLLIEWKTYSYMEIGCRYGDSLHYVCKRVPSIEEVFAIDWPGGPGGRADSKPYLEKAARSLRGMGKSVAIRFVDSRMLRPIDFRGRVIDAAFIDGGHTHDVVASDIALCLELNIPLIGVHDVLATRPHIEVPAVWRKLEGNKFVIDDGIPGCGIGVLQP